MKKLALRTAAEWGIVLAYMVIFALVCSSKVLNNKSALLIIISAFFLLSAIADIVVGLTLMSQYHHNPPLLRTLRYDNKTPWLCLIAYLIIGFYGYALGNKHSIIGLFALSTVGFLECMRSFIVRQKKAETRIERLYSQISIFIWIGAFLCILFPLKNTSGLCDVSEWTCLSLKIVFTSLTLGFLLIDVLKFYLPRKKTDVGHLMLIVITFVTIILCIV